MSGGAELEISLFDVTARADGQLQSQNSQPFAPASQLQAERNHPPAAATLEKDFFLLDGTLEPFPDNPQGHRWGLWSSAQSNEQGRFATPPVLRISFTQGHSSAGITLHFDPAHQDWCSYLQAAWLDHRGNTLAVRDFYPKEPVAFLQNKVEGYYGLELTFYETRRPGRYLKLEAIDYGLLIRLGGNDITAARVLEEADATGETLSINTLEFTLHAANGQFSPINPEGLFSVLQQGQQMELYFAGEQRQYLGRYHLERWESGRKNDLRMYGCDGVGMLERTTFMGGIYKGVTVASLVEQIFGAAGLGYSLHPELAQRQLWGYLPPGTARQALWQLAFAAGCVVDSSRNQRVTLKPPQERPAGIIGNERKFLGQTVTQKPVVAGIRVAAHRYQETQETATPFEDRLEPGVYTILFAEPLHSLTATGAVLQEAGAGYARLRVDMAGAVQVHGKRYKDMVQQFYKTVPGQGADLGGRVIEVAGATLVSPESAPGLLERLVGYYKNPYQTTFSVRLGNEQVADMVSVRSMKGENLKGVVERVELDLVRGGMATIQLAASLVDSRNYCYTGEIWTGEEWLL